MAVSVLKSTAGLSWLVHRWLLAFFLFEDCQCLFLRHTQSEKCITRSQELVYNYNIRHELPYYVVMTNNCLDDKAQFRYLDSELLQNIGTGGTMLSSSSDKLYSNRIGVYKGISPSEIAFQNNLKHRLKQTPAGSLCFYQQSLCAEPSGGYVMRKYCSTTKQEFTFGSVTNYGTGMENVHCSPIQHMIVNSANYGDFNKNGVFNDDKNIDTTCSVLTNCQVKSLCGGNRSCELTMNSNLLPSEYCLDSSKEIYTQYKCVDSYTSTTITTAPNIRLSYKTNKGYLQIKDGSTWRYVVEENWDLNRERMLCLHLGFYETDASATATGTFTRAGYKIATGDLICYNTQTSGTSCCVHLQPSTTKEIVRKMPYARCKICDKPLLNDTRIFPDQIFSGSGGSNYQNARFTASGWCVSSSGSYLLVDLQKEYHLTQIVIMADKEQTNWSTSYSMKYSHDQRLLDSSSATQVTGNHNGYQASTTQLESVYNARYIKINSTANRTPDFCIRIELCGEVQMPAPVHGIKITQSNTSANVTWNIEMSVSASSYITQIVIYLNGKEHQTISRRTQFHITGLKTCTQYTVGVQTQDGSLQKSRRVNIRFKTNEAVECAKSQTEQFNGEKIRLDLLIPLVISVLCFLLSLGVIVYQRRLIRINNKQACHKCEASEMAKRKEKFDTLSSKKTTKSLETASKERDSYMNDDAAYDYAYVKRISAEDKSATYMSLNDNKEPENFYQPLYKTPATIADLHHSKGGDDQTVEYENPEFNVNLNGD